VASASSTASGDAGSVIVTAPQITLSSGGQIPAPRPAPVRADQSM
jgi:hypothetical protein